MAYFAAQEETLDRTGLAALQRRKFARLYAVVRTDNPFYCEKLKGLAFDPEQDALERLPFTTRAELQRIQGDAPPYGTNLTFPVNRYTRLHHTSGSMGAPLRWLDTPEDWRWSRRCWSIIYRGAGLEGSDRILFAFSFGPFIGFWLAFEAAQELGNFCYAAGGLTTVARLRAIIDHGITVVCCTPTYALHMAEVAEKEGFALSVSPVRLLIVAGEPGGSIPAVRRRLETAWGARVIDHVGSTETSAWGFECLEAPGGVHVIESEFMVEVIDPATGSPLPDGRDGELVLTSLGRVGSPLIRYRTGDQVCLSRQRCACGRNFARCEGGVRGRLDDMLFIRGNNVFPSAIEGIVREFPGVAEFRMSVVGRSGLQDLKLEIEPGSAADGAQLALAIEAAIRDRLHFRSTVVTVAAGTLPRFEMKARRVVRLDAAGANG